MTLSPIVKLPDSANIVNIGLPLFETSAKDQGASVVGVDWRIPGGGDADVVAALGRLLGPKAAIVDKANAEVIHRLNEGVPILKGLDRAGAVIPNMGERTILHCGPSIAWGDMPNPLQRSIKAAIVAEGWVSTIADAEKLVTSGEVELKPANESSTVVPMATSIGPSAPVYVVSNEFGGTTTYSSVNQGSGQVAWFGVDSDEAIERLRFLRDAVGPVLAEAVKAKGDIDVLSLAAQGVPMGDDVHMRVQATTNLFLRDLLPHLVASKHERAAEVATFLSANHLMFLNVAMAAAKSLVDSAADVENSSIVTTMSRNGATYAFACLARMEVGSSLIPHQFRTRFIIPVRGRKPAHPISATARCWS